MKKRYPVFIILISILLTLFISACAETTTVELPEAPGMPGTPILSTGVEQIVVEWSVVEGAVSYEIWYGTADDTAAAAMAAGDVTGSTFTITGLSSETLYFVWLKAVNEAGASVFSSSARITTPDSTVPSEIYITGYSTGPDSIDISWDNPGDADFDCAVLTCKNGSSIVGIITISPDMETFSIKGLQTETEYSFSFEASDESGNRSSKTSISIRTLAPGDSPVDWLVISRAEDLNAFRDYMDTNCYLYYDIDLSTSSYSTGWTPLGDSDHLYSGNFLGNGHVISNLYINSGSSDYQGLFYGIDSAGRISDLSIEHADVTGGAYTGALAGISGGTVTNCSVTGNVSGKSRVGGLVGDCSGPISDCIAVCEVSGNQDVGGLIGYCSGDVSGSRTEGDVTASGSSAGGLVGYLLGSVSNCYAAGDIAGSDSGGLVGSILGNVSNCYATGDIAGNGSGGLAGVVTATGTVSGCYAVGAVEGVLSNGGLVSLNFGIIRNCCVICDVTVISGAGGFVRQNNGDIFNCYAVGALSGSSYIGGICAINTGTIADCFWNTEVSECSASDGGTGLTTDAMQTESTFTDAGWDFTNVWDIDGGYPFLTALGAF